MRMGTINFTISEKQSKCRREAGQGRKELWMLGWNRALYAESWIRRAYKIYYV